MIDAFQIQSFGNDVYLVRERGVASWLRCNIWYVKGRDRDLVIDTGMGLWPLKETLSRFGARPVSAVLTHSHFDHMGGSHEFEQRLGHRDEAHIFERPDCEGSDYSDFVRVETFLSSPWRDFDPLDYWVKPAPLTGYIDEGDVMDLGDRWFRVLHVPGHSPGSVALFEDSTGVLFSGDTLYDGDLYDSVYHSNPEHYLDSLERLSMLNVHTVHGGHFDSFDRERMHRIIAEYRQGRRRIRDPRAWVDDRIARCKQRTV